MILQVFHFQDHIFKLNVALIVAYMWHVLESEKRLALLINQVALDVLVI